MDQIEIYTILFGIIIAVGVLFRKVLAPTSLLLVITGMLISILPNVPYVTLKPELVLDIFLPLLIYVTCAELSWRDVKINLRPIALLSIGHVIFITFLIAVVIHTLIPQMGWPLAFLLGAVVSPTDDVAIVPIAEKIHMPRRIVTILKSEGMFNDATALILFRFSLAAVVTHQFSTASAISTFFIILIGETLYGLALGFIIGELRLRIKEPILQILVSILTPFLAYLPAERLGGCGVLATVVAALVIGHQYGERFSPEVRLIGHSVWTTLEFAVQSILFLLVGLDMRYIVERISSIPPSSLALYSATIIFLTIVGRFLWVYPATYLPRILFPTIRKRESHPRWQYAFVVSWAGMRGGISLAAALAVPSLPATVDGANSRDLLIFLVFCVITATLLMQGLTLPWILQALGIHTHGQREKHRERIAELSARIKMAKAVLYWLNEYKELVKDNPRFYDEIKFHIREYRMLKNQLEAKVKTPHPAAQQDTAELKNELLLSNQIIAIERKELSRLWQENAINHTVRNKLLHMLDLRSKHLSE